MHVSLIMIMYQIYGGQKSGPQTMLLFDGTDLDLLSDGTTFLLLGG